MLSLEAKNRMRGLTSQSKLMELMEAVDTIKDELEDEGFEKDEIAEYLAHKVKVIVNI